MNCEMKMKYFRFVINEKTGNLRFISFKTEKIVNNSMTRY